MQDPALTPSDITGKTAVVTGAVGGMGREICRQLVHAGADVFATDLNESGFEELADLCENAAGSLVCIAGDVSNGDFMRDVVDDAVQAHGGLDYGVNAAAIEFETVPLADCADEDFDRMMAVNTRGVFVSMKYELRAMLASGGGSIVNIASTNSYRPQQGQPAYTASKHAVLGLTRSAAIDYAKHDIRVNCVVPGAINTPMLHNAMDRRNRQVEDVAHRLSFFHRFGEPTEIAQAVLFLCSDASSFTTGHALNVDGGMLAG